MPCSSSGTVRIVGTLRNTTALRCLSLRMANAHRKMQNNVIYSTIYKHKHKHTEYTKDSTQTVQLATPPYYMPMQQLLDLLQQFTSAVILYCFLTVLFVLSLWNNYVTVHFKRKPDPRDIRGSHSKIRPKNDPPAGKRRRYSRGSISSVTPLDIEDDEENNIEYDHTISTITTGRNDKNHTVSQRPLGANLEGDLEQDPLKQRENPFASVLATEDRKLVPDLKYYYRQYNIDIEELEVETDDGFIIELWHLVPRNMTKDMQEQRKNCYPMLLLHGLLQSSGSFASGGRTSLAYYLFENGFDVWLGNNRCGFNPKWDKQTLVNNKKNEKTKFKKWDWDINEMCKYDLKALIEYILERSPNFEKLSLMAHSQGTSQSFYGLVNGENIYTSQDNQNNGSNFKLIDKIDNFIALAPAVYPGPLLDEKPFVKFMAAGIDSPWVFGRRSFIPLMMHMRDIAAGTKIFSLLSYVMFNYMFDWNDTLWDSCLRDRHFMFSPVHISVKLMQWWLSPDPNKISFKHGADIMYPPNKSWFPTRDLPQSSDGGKLHLNPIREDATEFPKILVFIPRQDRLVDGEKLINHFINHEDHSVYKIWYIDEYSHLDVLWAHDVIDRIGRPVLENIRLPKHAQRKAL